MKYHLYLLPVMLTMAWNMAIGQTTSSEGILLIDQGHALRGGRYLKTVQLAEDTTYNNDGRLGSDIVQKVNDVGGNALQIRYYCRFKRNKTVCRTFGEIYLADSTLAQVIPLKQHIDSLHASLGFDTATESMIVIFSSPLNTFSDAKSVFFFLDDVEGCSITRHAVCSYIMKGDTSFAINMEGSKPTVFRTQTGKALFFEVSVAGYRATARLVSLDYGYRICKAYQQIHDKQRLGQFAEEYDGE